MIGQSGVALEDKMGLVEDNKQSGMCQWIYKEVRVRRKVAKLAEQDIMGRVRHQVGAGFRLVMVVRVSCCRDTDKMPPKSPFVSD